MPRKISRKGLINKADIAWSRAVKIRAKEKCEVCGKTTPLNSHHYIGRVNRTTRWDIRNGVCLCVAHHKFQRQSAHEDPHQFEQWMQKHRKDDAEYINGVKNNISKHTDEDIKEMIEELEEIT